MHFVIILADDPVFAGDIGMGQRGEQLFNGRTGFVSPVACDRMGANPVARDRANKTSGKKCQTFAIEAP